MELLIALLAFMLIGLTSPASEYVYDVSVLSYYKVYTQTYSNDGYYFRISVNTQDNMYIQIETDYTEGYHYTNDFKVDICGYDHRPTNQECISGHQNCRVELTPTITFDREYYDETQYSAYYKYTFDTLDNVNYLAFCVTCLNPTRYFKTLYVYSGKTALAVWIILLIIFLPCICIAAIVVVVLRLCGCVGHVRIS